MQIIRMVGSPLHISAPSTQDIDRRIENLDSRPMPGKNIEQKKEHSSIIPKVRFLVRSHNTVIMHVMCTFLMVHTFPVVRVYRISVCYAQKSTNFLITDRARGDLKDIGLSSLQLIAVYFPRMTWKASKLS